MALLPPPWIRPIAVCILRRGDSIFVFEGHDDVKNQTFNRPLGGAIEFGERGEETVVREIREELGAELANVRYLATLEKFFVYQDAPGHEIVLVFEADFAGRSFYQLEETTGVEDVGASFKALWKPLAEFGEGGSPLYPDGLLGLLSPKEPRTPPA